MVAPFTQKNIVAGANRHVIDFASSFGGALVLTNASFVVTIKKDIQELGGVQLWEGGPYWAECNVGATHMKNQREIGDFILVYLGILWFCNYLFLVVVVVCSCRAEFSPSFLPLQLSTTTTTILYNYYYQLQGNFFAPPFRKSPKARSTPTCAASPTKSNPSNARQP